MLEFGYLVVTSIALALVNSQLRFSGETDTKLGTNKSARKSGES